MKGSSHKRLHNIPWANICGQKWLVGGNWEWDRSFLGGSEKILKFCCDRLTALIILYWQPLYFFFSFVVLGIKLSHICCTPCIFFCLPQRQNCVCFAHTLEYSNYHCRFLGLEHDSQQVVQKRVPKCWNSHLKLWVNWMYPVGTIGFKILPDDLIINTQRARNVNEIGVLFTVCCRVDAQGVLFLKLFRSHWTVVSECGSNCLLALVFIFIDNTWNSTKAWRTQNGAFGTERETPRTSGFTAVETSKYNSAKNSVNNIFHIYFLMYWVKLLLQTSNLRTNAGW